MKIFGNYFDDRAPYSAPRAYIEGKPFQCIWMKCKDTPTGVCFNKIVRISHYITLDLQSSYDEICLMKLAPEKENNLKKYKTNYLPALLSVNLVLTHAGELLSPKRSDIIDLGPKLQCLFKVKVGLNLGISLNIVKSVLHSYS